MSIRFRLPGGTLKFKSARNLRYAERNAKVPVLRLARLCIVWWPADIDSDGRKIPPKAKTPSTRRR